MESVAELPPGFAAKQRASRPRLSVDQGVKLFFGSNALVAIVVLALITIFLFREGFGFFGQNLTNIRLYRQSGLEYVDIMRRYADADAALSRGLNAIRLKQLRVAQKQNVPLDQITASLASYDQFATAFSDAAEPLNGVVSDAGDLASELKAQLAAQGGVLEHKADLEESGASDAAAQLKVAPVAYRELLAKLRESAPVYDSAAAAIQAQVTPLLDSTPQLPDEGTQKSFNTWKEQAREYLTGLTNGSAELRAWSPDVPVPWYRAITSFLIGRDWVTASFWQDWYGIIPLFVGSVMVSLVALVIAVPFGVMSAIYVSEVAAVQEKRLIKPFIEFISAIPSVVLGFFGIAVVGQAIRAASESPWLMKWVSFFPISERLNIFTAGSLLALMAVPTIFTLSEDALRNVPRGFKEASYALGANRLQTIARVLVPAALSGIVSAILLGLGRVIGETMVVLLCAGNRIQIPDFTEGLGAFFQPVHTMTGIIAQEMGEVVRGSIHYRALFMVGLVLFVLTLGINYLAQRLVARYRMSIG
ncbi:MAG: phosphate ABC transporter permease subunit PstC [Verrucomicrobiota bacterium]|nr:phosphate ABC transporter permease subunit PstC [Verrucomicrobiota bacterium]